MPYQITYRAATTGFDYQSLQQLVQILVAWTLQNESREYTLRYDSVLFDARNDAVRLALTVADIPDETPPKEAIDDLEMPINDAKNTFGVEYPDPANKAQIQR